MLKKLSPIEVCLKEFGGIGELADALGRQYSAVHKWTRPKDKQGTGGLIPAGAQADVILAARIRGFRVTPEDLIFGRTVRAKSGKN